MKEYRVYMDGNAWCATASGFLDLQESNAGFGETPLIALGELMVQETEDRVHELCKPDAIFGMGA